MSEEIVRICKVHGELTIDLCFIVKTKSSFYCRQCRKDSGRKFYDLNRDKCRDYDKKRREKNKELINFQKREWKKNNRDKCRNMNKIWGDKNRDKLNKMRKIWLLKNKDKSRAWYNDRNRKMVCDLNDEYIKSLLRLRGIFNSCDITDTMISLKRLQIKYYRISTKPKRIKQC